jgi:hypothetical protein
MDTLYQGYFLSAIDKEKFPETIHFVVGERYILTKLGSTGRSPE